MGNKLRVLFVDDSVDDVELTELELIRGEYEIESIRIETGADMRRALDEATWDVILCDFNMPQFSAAQALDLLHEMKRDIPFIILSGVVQAENVVSLLKAGAHDFLNKDNLARLIPAIERELREAQERCKLVDAEEKLRILSLAIEQSPVSVVITDRRGVIEYVNPKFETVTGYSSSAAMGHRLDFLAIEQGNAEMFETLWSTMGEGREWQGELCNVRRDGQLFWEYANVSPIKDQSGDIKHYIAVKEDITVRRSYEERLLRQAHYDDLTGLANRLLAFDHLDQAIGYARRHDAPCALLCIDLDKFKNVNDTMGHAVGDRLLKQAAQRLATCVRECDTLARIGGDEFVIVLPEMDHADSAKVVAERVVQVFKSPFTVDGQDHFVTSSIGIAQYPTDGEDHQTLLRNADLAMYKAKELGRNGYQFFTEEINLKLKARLELESQIRRAVSHQELELHYQPILDLKTQAPVGVETLLRWRHPDGHLSMPADFISVAEEIGLLPEIGDWVLGRACREISELNRKRETPVRLAVNVSPRQLQTLGFAERVAWHLSQNNLQPADLELEITEGVLMDDTPAIATNLSLLSSSDVRLSIDDFGTGYSSLGYLQKYPFHTLKIDRTFVSGLGEQSNAARLIETIIAMAHGMGLEVIAEGVETIEQMAFLQQRSCALAQGFLFSKPVSLQELPERLESIDCSESLAI